MAVLCWLVFIATSCSLGVQKLCGQSPGMFHKHDCSWNWTEFPSSTDQIPQLNVHTATTSDPPFRCGEEPAFGMDSSSPAMVTADQQCRIDLAREQLTELGEKYHGGDIPTAELFQFMDIEGFLDLDMRRNLKYISLGNGNLTEEELGDLEREGINSVNLFVDKFGMTPICRAMRQEDDAMIDRILSHPDFDPNVRNLNGAHPATPLMIAAEHKPQYLMRLLAHPDTDADLMDKFGYCALAIVLQYNPKYLPVMLASDKVSLNKNNFNNGGLLSFAVQKADAHCLELLFQHGASTDGFDNSAAPILISLVRERFDVLPILTKYGCKLHVDDLRDQIQQGTIDLDKVGHHIIPSNIFTAAELQDEFGWTG